MSTELKKKNNKVNKGHLQDGLVGSGMENRVDVSRGRRLVGRSREPLWFSFSEPYGEIG